MGDDGPALSGEEFVEYCRTQARLLAGRTERMREELADTLDDIDADIADARARLADSAETVEGTDAPQSTAGPAGADLDALEAIEEDLETKQAMVEAEQARIGAFQELAAGYLDLAEELSGSTDGRAALEAVAQFEADTDAPAYFEERQTVLEAADSDEDSDDERADG